MINLGFLGVGNMAGAIIRGISSTGLFSNENIHLYDISAERCEPFKQEGFTVETDAVRLTESSDIIFLCVKPQNIAELLDSIRISGISLGVKVFASIAAGISTSYISSLLGTECRVIRAMPNTPLLLSQGATAICRTENVPDASFQIVRNIFAACGEVREIEETFMNAIISVNGSSPAYIYLFAKAVVDYAAAKGIDTDIALSLFAQTLKGSASMLTDSGFSPDELIRMVSSPGGTTLAALDVFYQRGFTDIISDAMDACTDRAAEIGK